MDIYDFDHEGFAQVCKITINDPRLYIQAMTHRSFLNENKAFDLDHNERIEFLGDAVLELVVTEHLFMKFKNPEGELTAFRASLVNGEMLARVAREIGIEPFLRMSKGEAADTGRARNYLLANAMEAIIGAIYLDNDYDAAKDFITRTILEGHLNEVIEQKLYVDPKSYFQEKAQEHMSITPHYQVLAEKGPDHDKRFVVGVYLDKRKVATGEGTSKQEAQRDAARNGLEAKNWLHEEK